MLKGSSYDEVGRWLLNFANSHAKRESPRLEGLVENTEERKGRSYGLRLRIGDRVIPPLDQSPAELAYPEVSDGRSSFVWCDDLAKRIRGWARELLEAESDRPPKSA
ncbi:MAG: hypothetical protein ACE5JD_09155 [Candidatus Methylomirabilia bacterium]